MNLLLDSSFHCNDETKAFSQALFSELGDPLMFGAITVGVYDPDGEDFMINGMLTRLREQITIIADYAPDLLTELYIAENELSLEYWDEWSEE